MRRFFIFIVILVATLVLSGYYLGHRILTGSVFLNAYPVAVWSGVVIFLSLVFVGPMLSRILPESFRGRFYAVRWMINMTMAIFFSLLFYTLCVDLFLYLISLVVEPRVALALQEVSLLCIAMLVIVSVVIGAFQSLSPKIFHVEVPIKNLPTAFDGFKIAQISDLHIGEMIGLSYVEKVVDQTNSLEANIVALTGDIIDGAPELIGPVAQDLARLRATDGVLYVTGNHEYYWGVENALLSIRATGARVLLNENVRVKRGEAEIAIAGVTDISAGAGVPGHASDVEKSIRGVPPAMTKILLAHQPVSYRAAEKVDVDLQLSGHTHGGQFFPWSLVVRLFQHYNKGLIRHGKMWIYVNRGTATWGPRSRFAIPSEITLLTLRLAKS